MVAVPLNGRRLEQSAVDWYCRMLGELVRRLIAGIVLCGTVVAALQVLHIMQLNVEMCRSVGRSVLLHVIAGTRVCVSAACVHIKLQSNCSNFKENSVDRAGYNIKHIK